MATILVLAHEHDLFRERHFLLAACIPHWEAMGHRVIVHEGARAVPSADLAFVHVDRTVVPAPYIDALRDHRGVVNRAAVDLGKRVVSRQLVSAFDDYRGAVIVKTNANAAGLPERLHADVALRKGMTPEPAGAFTPGRYPIFESIAHVPPAMRVDPDLVIEKFLPERTPHGYAVRHWAFLGDRERCTRTCGPHPVVKAEDVTERTLVEVPDALRESRARLGLDFGKLDFVMHEGHPVLLDANRTPSLGDATAPYIADFAKGIAALLR